MTTTPEAIRDQILDLVKGCHAVKFAAKTFDPDKDLVHYAGRVFDAEEIVNLVDAGLDFYLTANRYAGWRAVIFSQINRALSLINPQINRGSRPDYFKNPKKI